MDISASCLDKPELMCLLRQAHLLRDLQSKRYRSRLQYVVHSIDDTLNPKLCFNNSSVGSANRFKSVERAHMSSSWPQCAEVPYLMGLTRHSIHEQVCIAGLKTYAYNLEPNNSLSPFLLGV